MLKSDHRVALLFHEGIQGSKGKTGSAYLRYGQAPVVVIIDAYSEQKFLENISIVKTVQEALVFSPDVLLIGIAPSGGVLPETWLADIQESIKAGLSVVNGLHTPLAPLFPHLKPHQWVWDIRSEPPELSIGQAKARSLSCKRILTVGTDMAIGKMSASYELYRMALKQGISAAFLATGQGGIIISGQGLPLDAVRVDFAAGAVEKYTLSLGANCDVLFIEGQGSILHPGSTATLPLLRGSQPTALILVHRFGQTHIRDIPEAKIPALPEVVQLYEMVASIIDPVKVEAIALNTAHLDTEAALKAIQDTQEETGLPCSDVVRFGGESLQIALK